MYVPMYVCVCVCVPAPRLLITGDMVYIPYDWLNEFYCFYMATVVSIVSRRGFSINVEHRSQPNKSNYK